MSDRPEVLALQHQYADLVTRLSTQAAAPTDADRQAVRAIEQQLLTAAGRPDPDRRFILPTVSGTPLAIYADFLPLAPDDTPEPGPGDVWSV